MTTTRDEGPYTVTSGRAVVNSAIDLTSRPSARARVDAAGAGGDPTGASGDAIVDPRGAPPDGAKRRDERGASAADNRDSAGDPELDALSPAISAVAIRVSEVDTCDSAVDTAAAATRALAGAVADVDNVDNRAAAAVDTALSAANT